MRILILTHPRSGGLSLLTWIFNEKKRLINSIVVKQEEFQLYHEPDLTNDEIKKTILNRNNIVVKLFPNVIDPNELTNFMDSFNKIIIHKRNNIKDVAISLLYSKLKENSIYFMHDVYELDSQWIEEHSNEIEYYERIVNEYHIELDKIIHPNLIRTSYESIHWDKIDVTKVCDYLNIKNPKWLDIIDKDRRLQNGNKGMNNFINSSVSQHLDKLLGR